MSIWRPEPPVLYRARAHEDECRPEVPQSSGRRRRPWAPVLAGAALGVTTFVAYLPGLGRSLDFDSAETVGMFIKTGPPWAAFERQYIFNNHPLFSFLEQLVRVVTGQTDAATMRVLPIACAALAVGVLTWFAARRHGLVAGLVAGAFLASNPTFASLSRSVRGYSLLTLCAVVSTVLVAEDRPDRSRWYDLAYVVVAGMGLATHLYMVPVLAAHVGVVVARRGMDKRWRVRFLGTLVFAAVAYAGMAQVMVQATGVHRRLFRSEMPWQVLNMVTGGGWALVVAAPLVIVGAVPVLRSRGARGAAIGLGAVLLFLWAGMQSSALSIRFFVWLVPGVAYLIAVAVGRIRPAALLGAVWLVLALAMVLPGYTSEPTNYRASAALLRRVDASGARGCVVDVGVPPMLGYLDTPGQFAMVTAPEDLDGCDVVVVAAWWPSTDAYFAADTRVIDAAERRYTHRTVIRVGDPALVFSTRPLSDYHA